MVFSYEFFEAIARLFHGVESLHGTRFRWVDPPGVAVQQDLGVFFGANPKLGYAGGPPLVGLDSGQEHQLISVELAH
jgi:hypothetical protein